MEAPKRTPGRSFCPDCGQKYAIPEAQLKAHPGQKFHATCRSCGTPFTVYWGDDGLVTEREGLAHDRGPDGRNVLPPGSRVGKYEMEAMIASGGSATIYRAFEMGANRTVALKVLHQPPDSDYGVRFRREVEVQGNLKHPNLMPIFDQGKVDGKPYYTMELLHKPVSLETIIALFKNNRLGYNPSLRTLASLEALVRKVLLPVTRAVTFANQNGIIHRDIKPGNVIIDCRTLHVYLIDFGICHLFKKAGTRLVLRGEEQAPKTNDKQRMAMGTARFMPPEQARGDVSTQGDVWALGALLHNLVSGDAPIAPAINMQKVGLEKRVRNLKKIADSCRKAGDHDEASFYEQRIADLEAGTHRTMKDVLRDAQSGTYVPLPAGTDPSLAAIVARAMAVDPNQRYKDAEQFGLDVKRWLDGQPVRAYMGRVGGGTAGLYQLRLYYRRNRNPIIAAAVAILLGAIVLVTQMLSSSSEEEMRIDNWMREARDSTSIAEQEDRLTKVLALRPGFKEAQDLLAIARKFGPIKKQIEEAADIRRKVMRLRAQKQIEVAGQLAEDTAAVLETVVLPALRELPKDYPGRRFERQAVDLANFLRGRRVVRLSGVPSGVQVALVAAVSRNNPALLWDKADVWGTAPLTDIGHPLAIGSYVLKFRRPDRNGGVNLPFTISRGTPPGGLDVQCPFDPGQVPDGMVFVTGMQKMEYGDPRFQEETSRVHVGPFFLDVYEVSNAAYARFLNSLDEGYRRRSVPRRLLAGPGDRTAPTWTKQRDGTWAAPDGTGSFPVTGVSFLDAADYARWAKKRLPTPQEWELAARGVDGRDYPFGTRLDTKACNAHTRDLKPRGKYPRDLSPYGVRDMAGNVAEWTGSGGSTLATVKGGSFELPRYRAIATSFGRRRADLPCVDVGFRCAQDIPE